MLTDGKTPFEVKPPWPGAKQDRPPARVRALADAARPPADGPRDGQPHLEAPLRHGHRRDPRQLRQGRHAAHAPRAARLAGARVRAAGLEPQGDAPADDDQRRPTGRRRPSTPELAKLDPENALYSRMPLVRLDAEALYDTLLLVAGRLDETRVGPADPVQVARATGW